MAVSIDTVYQKVLMLANKEQRGYITPQEFNLFADHAQKEIFEQYFYDLNQLLRVPSNSDEYADIPDNLQEKIVIFETNDEVVTLGTTLPARLYRLGTIVYSAASGVVDYDVEIEEVQHNELLVINSSPLSRPTTQRPIYTREDFFTIQTYPAITTFVRCNYTRQPAVPSWGYVVVNEKAMYDPFTTTDFELHASEESELVYKILKFAGVTMRKQDIMKGGQGLETMQIAQEKQ